jgi:large subunit ribosomal protein L18
MVSKVSKNEIRERIHKRIRRRLAGTTERPRLTVFRSLAHTYAQLVDDSKGATVVSASTAGAGFEGKGGNVAAAKAIGQQIAQKAIDKGIKKVVFDRGGYIYHGRIKALADAAREAGLEF